MATHKLGNIDADPEQNDWIRVVIARKRGIPWVAGEPLAESVDDPPSEQLPLPADEEPE